MFSKGLVHGFIQKLAIFPSFHFRQNRQEIVFHDTLKRKNASLNYVNKKLKKAKNLDFSERARPLA